MKKITLKKAMLFVVGALMFGMVIWFAISADTANMAFYNDKVYTMDGEFNLQYKGGTMVVNPPTEVATDVGDTMVITKVLNKEEVKGNSIMFYARQSHVNVYVGEEQLIRDLSGRKMPFEMTAGAYWYFFRLPADWEGKELRIEIQAEVARFAGEIPTIYTGNMSAFIYMVVQNGTFAMLTCVPVLVFGLMLVAFGIFSFNKDIKSRLVLLGFFAITTSIWNLLEARITQVFYRDVQLANIVLFSCYYMVPCIAACYLHTYRSFRKFKIMTVLMYVMGGIYIVLQVLQAASVIRYVDFVPLGYIMIGVVIIGVIVNYFLHRRQTKRVENGAVYRAMILLAVFCLIDVFRYNISPQLQTAQFSKIGFLLFFFYLGFSVITQMNEAAIKERENLIYKRLAFIDNMTQINNRTAFEQKLHTMRQKTQVEPTYFFMADMNNLKYINDTYGHSAGDHAVIEIANTLAECFEDGECYRIGGDEFCVITEGVSEDKIIQYRDEVRNILRKKSATLDYDIVVAVGYCKLEQGNIDECFNTADALMYKDKADLKQENNRG